MTELGRFPLRLSQAGPMKICRSHSGFVLLAGRIYFHPVSWNDDKLILTVF